MRNAAIVIYWANFWVLLLSFLLLPFGLLGAFGFLVLGFLQPACSAVLSKWWSQWSESIRSHLKWYWIFAGSAGTVAYISMILDLEVVKIAAALACVGVACYFNLILLRMKEETSKDALKRDTDVLDADLL